MTGQPFTFECSGRSLRTTLVVLFVWLVLAVAWMWLDAATWIIILFAAFTLPAVFDLARNPSSGLHLCTETLSWHAGKHSAKVALAEIDHMRLDTRLDFSVRATVVLKSGRKIRLPFEVTPPHQTFEDALLAVDVRTKRFHFQLLQ